MTAYVVFENSTKEYSFKVPTIKSLELQDHVLCDTARGFQIGIVVRLEEENNPNATKYIVDKIDYEHFVKSQIIEVRQKEIIKQLNEICNNFKKQDAFGYYSVISTVKPEVATLLSEYKHNQEDL